MTIGIIDYGMGNLRSVQKALQSVGGGAEILRTTDEIKNIDQLILPGVGAFADAMQHLNERGWVEPMRRWIEADRPFLGICLGMQLLFEFSEEGDAKGLSILPGRIVRFDEQRGGEQLKVPHMGWNTLQWTREDPLLSDLEQGAAVYFVHAFYAQPDDPSIISAQADYGQLFCASIWRRNLWAMQFHPEKSQRVGLSILRRFVKQAKQHAPS